MPLELIRTDITGMRVDAVINAANSRLQRGGGVCGAIFARSDGEKLQSACDRIGYCAPGGAVLTKSYGLPAPYIIHTVGPVWQDGMHGEKEQLASCYIRSLDLAAKHRFSSVAFPLISSGIYGCPPGEALSVAISAISGWLMNAAEDILVYLVLYDKKAFGAGSALHHRIRSYIDDHYVEEHTPVRRRAAEEIARQLADEEAYFAETRAPSAPDIFPEEAPAAAPEAAPRRRRALFPRPEKTTASAPSHAPRNLEDVLSQTGESFSQMLFRLIDERNLTDPEVYKRANLDRKLFSKIRSNPQYQPGKSTVLALAIALCLNIDQTTDLLRRAGFALSPSSKSDLIIEFCIREGITGIHEINEILFSFDQKTLGAQ